MNYSRQLPPLSKGVHSLKWKQSLFALIILFCTCGLSTAKAVSVGDQIPGNKVYTNTGTSKVMSSASYLTYTVLTTTSTQTKRTVSVKATSGNTITGALNIPSVIYYQSYPYYVTEVSESAFKGQTGITDVYFTKDPYYGYEVTTIGKDAFAGTTGLTGDLQLPQTITSIGDNAFGVSTPTNISNVIMGANSVSPKSISVGAGIFIGRTITNLHLLGNFGSHITIWHNQALFSEKNVTNVYYYGDGTSDSYYDFLTTIEGKGFGLPGQNIYLPSDEIKSFVDNCTKNNHTDWIPSTVNCLTFEHEVSGVGTFTFMLYANSTNSKGPQLALHSAKLNDGVTDLKLDFSAPEWDIDLMPTVTGLTPDITMIDSKAFAGNDNLQSITIIPDESDEAVTLKGDAFAGAKALRYIDLSQSSNFSITSGYTLSRIPTTDTDESTPYKYTKSTSTYDYELTSTSPFGGLPAYTLVFLPQNIKSYPTSTTEKETVYKTDGTTATSLTRPTDENFVLHTDNSYTCNNFGVYDITDLDATTASNQSYSWYSFLNPHAFTAANSKFYRQFSANVPSTVCLPFKPDATSNGKYYTYKSNDDTQITLTTVDAPQAATPYFFYPSNATTLSSTTSQTISTVTTADELTSNSLHGVYAGTSLSGVSGTAYGMASTAFTYNGNKYPAGTFVKFSSSAYLNPFRAYLLLSSSSSAKAAVMRMVVDDTPTGINSLQKATEAETPYYNLQGMKTAVPTKGIYIHNGKKIIMK